MKLTLWKVFCFITAIFTTAHSHGAATEWIEFSLDNGHIKIPVSIADIDTHAIMDTGAQANVINSAFMKKHGLDFSKGKQVRISGVFGEERKSTLNNVPVDIFGFETELDQVIPAHLGNHSNGLLLGAGFFANFIVQLDYPNSRMRLITRDALDLKSLENLEMRSQKGSGEPLVKVSFGADSSPFWVLLDTGSNGGLLIERSLAKKHNLLEKITSSSLRAGVNSVAAVESLRAEEFVFGPFTLENVLVTVPAEGQTTNLVDQNSVAGSRIKSVKQKGILGYDVLKHFVLTLDYRSGRAHIGLPE